MAGRTEHAWLPRHLARMLEPARAKLQVGSGRRTKAAYLPKPSERPYHPDWELAQTARGQRMTGRPSEDLTWWGCAWPTELLAEWRTWAKVNDQPMSRLLALAVRQFMDSGRLPATTYNKTGKRRIVSWPEPK